MTTVDADLSPPPPATAALVDVRGVSKHFGEGEARVDALRQVADAIRVSLGRQLRWQPGTVVAEQPSEEGGLARAVVPDQGDALRALHDPLAPAVAEGGDPARRLDGQQPVLAATDHQCRDGEVAQ